MMLASDGYVYVSRGGSGFGDGAIFRLVPHEVPNPLSPVKRGDCNSLLQSPSLSVVQWRNYAHFPGVSLWPKDRVSQNLR